VTRAAVLAPGYGGTADQPILVALGEALGGYGIAARRITFTTRGRPKGRSPYASEIADVRAARDALRADGATAIALVGRSFGGRICAFLAAEEPPDALAIIGHPISPPGRPRPRDEAALEAVACPTLVVQGDLDDLGPITIVERIAARNPRIDVVRLAGAKHELRAGEQREAVHAAARWIDSMLW